jgi:hypothetical protein
VPAVGVALVIVVGFFLLLPRPLVKPPERLAAPPAQPHTPEPVPEFAPKPVDPALVQLRTSGTAVQRDFANGVFQADDPVEKLLAKHKPVLHFHRPGIGRVLLYAPDEWGGDRTDRTGVVLVYAIEEKLVQAGTRVRTGAGTYRGLSFFKESFLGLLEKDFDRPTFWRGWDMILDLVHPAVVPAHMAVAGAGVWNRVLLPW